MGKEKTVNCELDDQHPNWFLTAQALREEGQLQMGPVRKEEEFLVKRKYSLVKCKGKRDAPCEKSYRVYWPMEFRSKCPYCGAYNNNPV